MLIVISTTEIPTFLQPEPIEGLLSKDYSDQRRAIINWQRNDPNITPGDPYPFQGGKNPFPELLEKWPNKKEKNRARLNDSI